MANTTTRAAKKANAVSAQKLVAISYARVSTGRQSAEDRSGIERQAGYFDRFLMVR